MCQLNSNNKIQTLSLFTTLNIWKLKVTARDNIVSMKFIIMFQETELLLLFSITLPSISSHDAPCHGILGKLKVYMGSKNSAQVCGRKSQL